MISDRDGVMLVEGMCAGLCRTQYIVTVLMLVAHSADVPMVATKPPFLGIFSIASEQVS